MSQTRPVLAAEGVTKSFRSGAGVIPVLRGASISISAGERVAIRGESGSGKTTLLNLLAGLEAPDQGTIRWQGEALPGGNLHGLAPRRARWLGMVFQAYHLVTELNLFENVLLAARIAGRVDAQARERAASLLGRVGLGARLRSVPAELSGGERQRVAVARALLNRPAVVLADEPTGNLDERTGREVMDLLLEVCREEGAALVLVTHNAAHAARCDSERFLHLGRFEDPDPAISHP